MLDDVLLPRCCAASVGKVCGTPDARRWPGHEDLPSFATMMPKTTYPDKLRQHVVSRQHERAANLQPSNTVTCAVCAVDDRLTS